MTEVPPALAGVIEVILLLLGLLTGVGISRIGQLLVKKKAMPVDAPSPKETVDAAVQPVVERAQIRIEKIEQAEADPNRIKRLHDLSQPRTWLLPLLLPAALAGEPRPVRADPAPDDMDAKGYPDKVPFFNGTPVQAEFQPETGWRSIPIVIPADAILVAPSYLAWLERVEAWSAIPEAQVATYEALPPTPAPVPWIQRPLPNLVIGVGVGIPVGFGVARLVQL